MASCGRVCACVCAHLSRPLAHTYHGSLSRHEQEFEQLKLHDDDKPEHGEEEPAKVAEQAEDNTTAPAAGVWLNSLTIITIAIMYLLCYIIICVTIITILFLVQKFVWRKGEGVVFSVWSYSTC